MWSTILLLLAGFAIGVVFILFAEFALLAVLALALDDDGVVAKAMAPGPMSAVLPPAPERMTYPWSPGPPHRPAGASPPYPRYPGDYYPLPGGREYRS